MLEKIANFLNKIDEYYLEYDNSRNLEELNMDNNVMQDMFENSAANNLTNTNGLPMINDGIDVMGNPFGHDYHNDY
ncbi:hypothetical protein ACFGZ0_11700 [Pasteurella multocida]|nr:hypothetical protein [Pasteurella multocida]